MAWTGRIVMATEDRSADRTQSANKEEAFVLNNFDAFAKYFAPRATDTVEREVVQCVEDLVSAVERA